ncbi:hypothetical protein [Variovorax sp. GT1P44]|uniref:hypothetical protein n=1 Tax=Variovorax sp. GT1P44 TaxID=3443742 RepID=UPI003F456A15
MTEPTLQSDEYASLHEEATRCMAELALLERWCVVGATAVLAWLATHAEMLVGYAGLAWLLPVAIAAYGSLKGLAIRRHIAVLGVYLKELEGQPAGGQWRKHFGRRWAARRWPSVMAWLLFVAMTVAGSALGFVQFRSECPGPLLNACAQDDSDDGPDREEGLKQGTALRTGLRPSALPASMPTS